MIYLTGRQARLLKNGLLERAEQADACSVPTGEEMQELAGKIVTGRELHFTQWEFEMLQHVALEDDTRPTSNLLHKLRLAQDAW